jgi:hypothetical protein
VQEIYPPESFIGIDFAGSMTQTVSQIKDIYINDDYEDRLPHILEAKNLYYTKYNIFNFLDKMLEKGKI